MLGLPKFVDAWIAKSYKRFVNRELLLEAMKAAEKAVLQNQREDKIYGVKEGASPVAAWPKDPCKIVFLDFDGVLNCERSIEELKTRYRFSKPCVAAVNSLLRETEAFVVITSSWRNHWTLRENAEFLERDGLLKGRVLGKTPTFEAEPRGIEIDAWLKSAPYAIESFVIVDDRNDMEMHADRLVQVNPSVGLTEDLSRRAAEILRRS
jgi:hypothetical protein